jgi:signal transduction histidine kinase
MSKIDMSDQSKLQLNIIIFAFESNAPYFRSLHDELQQHGHQSTIATSALQALDCLETYDPGAIISDDSHPALTLLKDIDQNAFDETERPFLLVITEGDLNPEMDNIIDIYLPPLPTVYLERHIRSSVNYRHRINKLKHSEKEISLLKNAIVRNVSHELKTPLLQVKAAVGLIAEDAKEDPLTHMAVTATARLETVIKNITLLADSLNGSFGPFIISESIEQSKRNLRRSWEHKNDIDRIKITIDKGVPPVLADKHGISTVMQQLMDNALKFSKGSGNNIHVVVEQVPTGVCIKVEDFGIGIAADKLKQIFETFYQIDNSSTRRYGGTGVGLSIVRLILEKHDIEIHVESQLERGSTFSFVLPIAEL